MAQFGGERELADHEAAAPDLADREIGRRAAREHAQGADLARGGVGVGRGVATFDADEDQEAVFDLADDVAVDDDARLQHALDQADHRAEPTDRPAARHRAAAALVAGDQAPRTWILVGRDSGAFGTVTVSTPCR